MKKLLLLVVLILIAVFVGKYVYNKQATKGSVTLGESNTANVSVSKDQELVVIKGKRGDVLTYTGTMKVVSPATQASSSFTFLNMPVLYKLIPGTTQYAIATSAIPTGNIRDAKGQIYPLTGPIFIIGGGTLKQYTVNAVWANLPAGTYKASLGTSNSWSGYSINGGALQPLPTMQARAVVIASSTPVQKNLTFTFASTSLILVQNGANGSVTGAEARFRAMVTPVGMDVTASSLQGAVQLKNATSGQVLASSTAVVVAPSGVTVFRVGNTYPVDFMVAYGTSTIQPGNVYKAQLVNAWWNYTDMSWANAPWGTGGPTTGTVTY